MSRKQSNQYRDVFMTKQQIHTVMRGLCHEKNAIYENKEYYKSRLNLAQTESERILANKRIRECEKEISRVSGFYRKLEAVAK